jgi:hypothetical protein
MAMFSEGGLLDGREPPRPLERPELTRILGSCERRDL